MFSSHGESFKYFLRWYECMQLFRQSNAKLEQISESGFQLEKELQSLVEGNLGKIFGLEFVCSELALDGLRIDTLAYDAETNSFVIVEYKREKNLSVIDQGFSYLNLMLNNKADFVMEYLERTGKKIDRKNIDWSQSKVLFVCPGYTTYQLKAIEIRDLPIELWEVQKYGKDTWAFNRIQAAGARESIKAFSSKSDVVRNVSKEVRVYTEEELVQKGTAELQSLYEELKSRIMDLGDDIRTKPTKLYMAFKRKTNFVDVEIQTIRLKIFINMPKGSLDDPKGIAKDVSETGHWGNGDYEVHLNKREDLPYLLTLIQQSYERNSK